MFYLLSLIVAGLIYYMIVCKDIIDKDQNKTE